MSALTTQSAILRAGERLFAQHGFSEVSLRQIISASRVNLAAIHYHFGSKEALIQAILRRRITPLNEERLQLLQQALASTAPHPPPLEVLLHALLSPPLRLSRDRRRGGDLFMRLMGRALSDPNPKIQEMLVLQFKTIVERFVPAFQSALPDLSPRELFWRLHFTVGGMAHAMTHGEHLKRMSEGLCNPDDTDFVIDNLVAFAAAGLRAPVREGVA